MSECDCRLCVRQCELNPGWMTPAEARAAIAAGLAGRLMADWLDTNDDDDVHIDAGDKIWVLAPACEDHEKIDAPEMPTYDGGGDLFSFLMRRMTAPPWNRGRCVLLDAGGKCTIHTSGFKPIACRESRGCAQVAEGPDQHEIAALWDNEEGREIVRNWRALVVTL